MQTLSCYNDLDVNLQPAGGRVTGIGVDIHWNTQPLENGQNGAVVDDVIEAARQRLEFLHYVNPTENVSNAIALLEQAATALHSIPAPADAPPETPAETAPDPTATPEAAAEPPADIPADAPADAKGKAK